MKNIRLLFFVLLAVFSPALLDADELPVLSVIVSADGSFGADNATAVLSIITAHVTETGLYRVVSAAQREAAIRELAFSLSDLADAERQLRVGKLLAASLILSAQCSKAGDYQVVQLSLVDVQTGSVVKSALGKYRNLGTLLESARSLVAECLGIAAAKDESGIRFVTVKNSTELLRELKSNTVITLAPGIYNLTGKNDIVHGNLAWEDMYDGFSPVVKSISNLTLKSNGDASVVIDPAYGWVMEFRTGQNIRLERIVFSHTKPGNCAGGVLRFQLCENVDISDCRLDGSGTYGLGLDRTYNLTMNHSVIQNCTYGIMQSDGSRDLLFVDSVFSRNREFTMIEFFNTSNVTFINCVISGNIGQGLVSADTSSFSIVFQRTRFEGNRVGTLFNDRQRIKLEECVVK
ncbi:MAG: hypothetical protein EHM28_07835 [Spirochaetaceae bacterium]|nr:MAG: hypothetical protein EHM28_07835 [Spirochaetaceae bacterium]